MSQFILTLFGEKHMCHGINILELDIVSPTVASLLMLADCIMALQSKHSPWWIIVLITTDLMIKKADKWTFKEISKDFKKSFGLTSGTVAEIAEIVFQSGDQCVDSRLWINVLCLNSWWVRLNKAKMTASLQWRYLVQFQHSESQWKPVSQSVGGVEWGGRGRPLGTHFAPCQPLILFHLNDSLFSSFL